jgi:hypothetical protein
MLCQCYRCWLRHECGDLISLLDKSDDKALKPFLSSHLSPVLKGTDLVAASLCSFLSRIPGRDRSGKANSGAMT